MPKDKWKLLNIIINRVTQGNSIGGIKHWQKESDPRWVSEARKECYVNKIVLMWEKTFYKIQYPGIIKIFGKQRLDEKFFNLLSNPPNKHTHHTLAKIPLKGKYWSYITWDQK